MEFKLQLEEAIDSANAMAEKKDAESITAEGVITGRYTGLPVQLERSLDDRSGTLLRALTYFEGDDPDEENTWAVPAGAWLDGASIPRPFWSIIGGPYSGKFFPASVVHDHYCIIQTRTWRSTHRMFHAAMRTNGVGRVKAKIMFYAVYKFGPRWKVMPRSGEIVPETTFVHPAILDDTMAESLLNDMSMIIEGDPSLEDIEAMAGL